MEKYRGDNQSYATSAAALGISSTSPDGYYTIAVDASATNATAFVMTATPVAGGARPVTVAVRLQLTRTGPTVRGPMRRRIAGSSQGHEQHPHACMIIAPRVGPV